MTPAQRLRYQHMLDKKLRARPTFTDIRILMEEIERLNVALSAALAAAADAAFDRLITRPVEDDEAMQRFSRGALRERLGVSGDRDE